ncbi:MAG: 3-phosphoshikimate 1-carboxyvinyltransferase [Thermodesulfobacteriota bacterium]
MALSGSFFPPGDKSISHRLALISLLAQGESKVINLSPCEDVRSSLKAVRTLGGTVKAEDETYILKGLEGGVVPEAVIDCGNSGTTARMLMGLLAGRAGSYVLDGDASLRSRPMERAAELLRRLGATITTTAGGCPIKIRGGRLQGGHLDLPVASAQLKSAAILAGLQASGETRVREPAPSRDHTERLLALMGAEIKAEEGRVTVRSSELTMPAEYYVPGDASSAAFFLGAAAISPGSQVTAERMLLNPTRVGFLAVLRRMGVRLTVEIQDRRPEPWGRVTVHYSPEITGVQIEAEEIPTLIDEVPILALVATQAQGLTVFNGVGELRVKESDRLTGLAVQLASLQARIWAESDKLFVQGPTVLKGGESLDALGDHRLAMTLRLAILLARAKTRLLTEESVRISYPGFHEELKRLWR